MATARCGSTATGCRSRSSAPSPPAPAAPCATCSNSFETLEDTMTRTTVHGLEVDTALKRFVDEEVLPGTGVDSAKFWSGFDAIVKDLAPKNAALLAERDRLQAEMDAWHQANPGPIRDMAAYRAHLQKIGYL